MKIVESFQMFVSICVHRKVGNLMRFFFIPKCLDSQYLDLSLVYFWNIWLQASMKYFDMR